MKHAYTFLGSVLAFLLPQFLCAQCVPLANATEGITLTGSAGGTDNRSGVAYDPARDLYYSVDAGSPGYPLDTYTGAGVLVSNPAQGFDYRGAWWNPATEQLEGNGYDQSGIFVQTLDAGTGYPTGTGITLFAADQPDPQSVGTLDTDADEIIYYSAGSIFRYSRATNMPLGSYAITGLPVTLADINSNSVAYTGCPGHEIGIYDYTNRRLLYINKVTGAYSTSCQLPASAPQRASFGMSYANGTFWLFELNMWHGYVPVQSNVGLPDQAPSSAVSIGPNPATDLIAIHNASGSAAVALVDMSGRLQPTRLSHRAGDMQVDVSALAPGTYVLQITSPGFTLSERVMKIE